MTFWGWMPACLKKICICDLNMTDMPNFRPYFSLNVVYIMIWKFARYFFLRFFFLTDAGDFTCLTGFFSLMWEILHACRESGRNSVQAGDSLSMRESWKPCHKTHRIGQEHITRHHWEWVEFPSCMGRGLWPIHTLRVHYAHAVANLNSGYSKYAKVSHVHYFCTIALRTTRAVLTRAWGSRRVNLFSERVIIFCW